MQTQSLENSRPVVKLLTQEEQIMYFFKFMKAPCGRMDDFLHEYHVFFNNETNEYVIARYNYSTGLFVFPYSAQLKEETGSQAFVTREIYDYKKMDTVPVFHSRKGATDWAKKNGIQVSKNTMMGNLQ